MKINADIGEMAGTDAQIMPHLSIGNIACGYHASNPDHMAETVRLAISHGVKISAHPSYFDLDNFGRVSIPYTAQEITKLVEDQVCLLETICSDQGAALFAIKPHGALYHDMMKNDVVRDAIICVAKKHQLPLIVQAVPPSHSEIEWDVPVLREVFADRAYDAEGVIKPRSQPGSVHLDAADILQQAKRMLSENVADTLCFHGDNPASVAALKSLHA